MIEDKLKLIEDYYLSIKYNYSIPDIEKMMFKFISTTLNITDDSDQFGNEVNKIMEEIITKYDKDDE